MAHRGKKNKYKFPIESDFHWEDKKVYLYFSTFIAMVHELKTWPEYFRLVESGEKTFELRKNDRGFLAGHELLLREFDQHTQKYTGQTLRRKITYLLNGSEGKQFGLKQGYCIMSLK